MSIPRDIHIPKYIHPLFQFWWVYEQLGWLYCFIPGCIAGAEGCTAIPSTQYCYYKWELPHVL